MVTQTGFIEDNSALTHRMLSVQSFTTAAVVVAVGSTGLIMNFGLMGWPLAALLLSSAFALGFMLKQMFQAWRGRNWPAGLIGACVIAATVMFEVGAVDRGFTHLIETEHAATAAQRAAAVEMAVAREKQTAARREISRYDATPENKAQAQATLEAATAAYVAAAQQAAPPRPISHLQMMLLATGISFVNLFARWSLMTRRINPAAATPTPPENTAAKKALETLKTDCGIDTTAAFFRAIEERKNDSQLYNMAKERIAAAVVDMQKDQAWSAYRKDKISV